MFSVISSTQEAWITLLTPIVGAFCTVIIVVANKWASDRNRAEIAVNTLVTAETREKVDAASEAVKVTAEKLDATVTSTEHKVEEAKKVADKIQEEHGQQLTEIHDLVNGRVLRLLEEAAKYARLFANQSNDPSARLAATEAEEQVQVEKDKRKTK